ncbi:DUF5667 domain-containing protein [Actinokineospora diospyrosa]|uniref:DUF5667 domain-containing protein n=1 Tax=Actinokineospora diospyrosa TaxID=103728 RepID=A0ABT1IHR0_9PSEU|nr:DUF5667 domain-containing protein [Actinokineospora diospyrosa]MCP2272165.1 hypothetical protein [Actinokineospora diospyrosa]
MVDSGAGSTGPQGERADRPRAGRAHPGLVDELGPEFTDDDHAMVELLATLSRGTAPSGAARERMRAKITASLVADPQHPDRAADPDLSDLPDPSEQSADPALADRDDQPRGERPSPSPRRAGEARQGRQLRAGRAPRGRRDPDSAPAPRPSPSPRGSARTRFTVAAVAVLALVFSLAGMSLLLARDALPGDALYGVKRTGEAAALGLTFGEEEKAFKHLEFATARVTEIETLALRYANPNDAPTSGYLAALGDFDNDAIAGSRALTAIATGGDGNQLATLRAWADQQGARLAALRPKLPSETDSRLSASLTVLDRVEGRAAALLARMACYQVTSGDLDEIGALPATVACEVRPDAPRVLQTPSSQAGNTPSPGSTDTPQPTSPQPGQATVTTTPAAPRTTTPPPLVDLPPIIGSPSPSPGTSTPVVPGVPVPLPLPLPPIELPQLLPGIGPIRIG